MHREGSVRRAISPLDDRYYPFVRELAEYFSEFAYYRYRIDVELAYLEALYDTPIAQWMPPDKKNQVQTLRHNLPETFTEEAYRQIQEYEQQTRHDIKAMEHFLHQWFHQLRIDDLRPFIHLGLTSQDVNHVAQARMMRDACHHVLYPALLALLQTLQEKIQSWIAIPMLARTHGQPATPTTLGKEYGVFAIRLTTIIQELLHLPWKTKFGGATGTFAVWHLIDNAFPWQQWIDQFLQQWHLEREPCTTQISHYDTLALRLRTLASLATILIDLAQDTWLYMMLNYLTLRRESSEVGSSTMPHKVNPTRFETAEGNLWLARSLLNTLADKLPVSRLQRDLSDSTLIRNLGVALAHLLVAIRLITEGMQRLQSQTQAIQTDLDRHWEALAEALQIGVRLSGYTEGYEILRQHTQGLQLTPSTYHQLLRQLPLNPQWKTKLARLTPGQYTGLARQEAQLAIQATEQGIQMLKQVVEKEEKKG